MTAQAAPESTHSHGFDAGNPAAERGTRLVVWITLAAMAGEILAGWWFNSMALLADGWHMSSHALAIGLAAFAYAAARRHAGDPSFAFGTWKIEVLGGFASAVLLLVVAVAMVAGSVERLVVPQTIHYREAIAVAAVSLAVNLLCACILGRSRGHGHAYPHHDRGHHHHHDGGDLDPRSAYRHVWRVGKTSYACALSVQTRDAALTPEGLRQRLAIHEEIAHSTIEIQFADRD